jgi:hypothetical protein
VKMKSAVVIIPLLVLFLFTWLSLRGMNPEAEEFDRALSALNGFTVAESALQRDVLAARSGLLRNYDPLVRENHELSAATLRLTLDTSPETAGEVQQLLNALAAERVVTSDDSMTQALLAHGRLLRKLLPQTDATLKALFALPIKNEQRAVRSIVLERQLASRNGARDFRLLLYAASVVLVGILIGFGLQLRTRALALRRRAAFEHVIAGISTRFINFKPHELAALVEIALAELADYLGADRAYLIVLGSPCQIFKWRRSGTKYPAGWPKGAEAAVAAFSGVAHGIVHVARVDQLPASPRRDTLEAGGVRSWICASNLLEENPVNAGAILGFDLTAAKSFTNLSALGLLPMALHAIAGAVDRQTLEQDRTRLERRLQQARRMETVGALTSGIAHNFNNIVGAILGHAEMAETLVETKKKPLHNITAIRRAAERARDLIDQLLTYGRRPADDRSRNTASTCLAGDDRVVDP